MSSGNVSGWARRIAPIVIAATGAAAIGLFGHAAPAADSFNCTPGKANPKTGACDCPATHVPVTVGGVAKCALKPAPTPTPTTPPKPTTTPSPPVTAMMPPGKCPLGMAQIPGGSYTTGDATNAHLAKIDPFCMDITEVTVAMYDACAAAGMCTPASAESDYPGISADDKAIYSPYCNEGHVDKLLHPVNCVDWSQAMTYCSAQGKRLPTEDEWEWAARGGPKGYAYPWGDTDPTDTQICWKKKNGTCPVASYKAGANPWGVLDLAGNVWEWTANKLSAGGVERIHRGGFWWSDNVEHVKAKFRNWSGADHKVNGVGFRCVK